MDGGKVGVSISKGGVYLDGTSVALEGSLDVLHFLKCIAHITGRRGGNVCFTTDLHVTHSV